MYRKQVEKKNKMSTAAPDRSIYARKVPGINENSLMFAMQNEQKDNEAHINEALHQTSPVVYQHMQRTAASNQQANAQHQQALLEQQQQRLTDEALANRAAQLASGTPTLASLANTVRAGVASTEESLEKFRRRVFSLDERVREYQQQAESDAKKSNKRLEKLEKTACTTIWIVSLLGIAVLAFLIALVVLLVQHIRGMKSADKLTIGSNVQQQPALTPIVPQEPTLFA